MPIVRVPVTSNLPLPNVQPVQTVMDAPATPTTGPGSCAPPYIWQASFPSGGYCSLPQSILNAPTPAGAGLTLSGPVVASAQYGTPVDNIQIAAYNEALSLGMDPSSVIGPNGTVIGPLADKYNSCLTGTCASSAPVVPPSASLPIPAAPAPIPVASSAPPAVATGGSGVVPSPAAVSSSSAAVNIGGFDIGSWLQGSMIGGIPNWGLLAGAGVLLLMMRG